MGALSGAPNLMEEFVPTYYFERFNLYFVRVPKTASTSIISLLDKKPTRRYWDNPLPQFTPDQLRGAKSFALVRDPIERFRSALGMWNARTGIDLKEAAALARQYPIDDPLQKVMVHFTPMHHYHFALGSVDRVWRFEDLPNCWPEIRAYIGLPPDTELPLLREGYNKPGFTERQRRRVSRVYGLDFIRFGYDVNVRSV